MKRLLLNIATTLSLMLCVYMLIWWGSALRVPADVRFILVWDGTGTGGVLHVPFWLPTAIFALLPAWRTCSAVMSVVVRRKRSRCGLCVTCGYDLRATLGRCPECGADPQRSLAPRRPTDVPGAAIATAVCFAGFAAFGRYAAVVENTGAAFVSFIFLLLTLSSALWCIVAFVLQRRRRRFEHGAFAVVTTAQGGGASRPRGDG